MWSRRLAVVKFNLELNLPPAWERIEDVRQAVQLGLRVSYGDDGTAYALAMVAAELFENAIKYGCNGAPAVRIAIADSAGRVQVSVTNAVEDGSPHLLTLARRLEWIRELGDSEGAYSAAIAQLYALTAAEPGPRSGLGIARIAYEGGCHLEMTRAQPGWITVTAQQRDRMAERAE